MFLDSQQKPNMSVLDFSCFCIPNPLPHPNPVMLKILAMKYGPKFLELIACSYGQWMWGITRIRDPPKAGARSLTHHSTSPPSFFDFPP